MFFLSLNQRQDASFQFFVTAARSARFPVSTIAETENSNPGDFQVASLASSLIASVSSKLGAHGPQRFGQACTVSFRFAGCCLFALGARFRALPSPWPVA